VTIVTPSPLRSALLIALAINLTSCAYRLLAPILPSQPQLRLLALSPNLYTIRLDTGQISNYKVPPDGRLKLDIPSFRQGCNVYLFDRIRVGKAPDPLKAWTIDVLSGGKTLRRLSVRAMYNLALDADGYRLLSVARDQ
jgi:hypothetical protein